MLNQIKTWTVTRQRSLQEPQQQRRGKVLDAAVAISDRGELITIEALAQELHITRESMRRRLNKDRVLYDLISPHPHNKAVKRARCLSAKRALEMQGIAPTKQALSAQMGMPYSTLDMFLSNYPDVRIELGLTKERFVGYPRVPFNRRLDP